MKIKRCNTLFSKATGLMFRKKQVMIFYFKKDTHAPLHMMFVFFPIDVFFLDKNKKILEIKKNFKPWRYYSPKKKCRYIVEAPKGWISKGIGQELRL